ncbi:hypothetical protein CVS40_2633 [Lucilia cuprina]|nr:hypothetical protein CVS40_2633 [Lucilia cuprina]
MLRKKLKKNYLIHEKKKTKLEPKIKIVFLNKQKNVTLHQLNIKREYPPYFRQYITWHKM